MSRILPRALACMAVFLAVSCSTNESTQERTRAEIRASNRPNIIFILTDDMRSDDLEHMPKTQELLVQAGTTFSNAFVPYSLCCPSRASILRGQYAHNHLVQTNEPPNGGFPKFYEQGHESSTVATWLKDAGYNTVLMGKYLNEYPGNNDESYIPPGWEEWYARLDHQKSERKYYDYCLNENGSTVCYGARDADYYTDVLARKARDYVSRIVSTQEPFFMYIAPEAPHGPWIPANRHKDMFADETVPRPPSFNEADVSDKPRIVRTRSSLTEDEIAEIDKIYRNRLRTLQAVDEMVEDLVGELQTQGVLDDTYVVLMSDNGWHQGEHRLRPGKRFAYEEDIRIPLVVRGPDVPAGETRSELALNTDIAPTFADLAGAIVPTFVDGHSLKPLLTNTTPPATTWRSAFLLESYPANQIALRSLVGVRTTRYKYVEYANGEKELYDLEADPYELDSVYETTNTSPVRDLKAKLDALKNCAGEGCREAEDTP